MRVYLLFTELERKWGQVSSKRKLGTTSVQLDRRISWVNEELSNATASICEIFALLFCEAHNPKIVSSKRDPRNRSPHSHAASEKLNSVVRVVQTGPPESNWRGTQLTHGSWSARLYQRKSSDRSVGRVGQFTALSKS